MNVNYSNNSFINNMALQKYNNMASYPQQLYLISNQSAPPGIPRYIKVGAYDHFGNDFHSYPTQDYG